MQYVIELHKVTKLYGKSVGAKNVTLNVQPGTVFGFLGPNGAGKTTTISMMMNLIQPTSGRIKILGLDSQDHGLEIRARTGYLSGDMALDRGLTGWQQLEYFGNLRGSFDKKYVRELAAQLDCKLNKKFKTLSRGNKQKVGLIAALMHKPELLILDEPTSGLDPLIQAEFNKIVLEHKARGGTVFVSSHILSEVQEICDEVAFIRGGGIVASKPLEKLTRDLPRQVQIAGADQKLLKELKNLKGITDLSVVGDIAHGLYAGPPEPLLKLLASHKLRDITIQPTDLETVFMKYYETADGNV